MVLRLVVFVIALAAAGGAAFLSMTMNGANQQAAQLSPQQIPTRDVLVAATPFTGGEVISPERVKWQPWPVTTINETYITREGRPDAVAELSGSFVNRAFAAGEPIRSERLMQTNANLLSNKIAQGRRAVAVKIGAENTAGGFILPGDRVDVIHTVTRQSDNGREMVSESEIIISNVRILAIDQTAVQNPEGAVIGKTATLELWPEQVELVLSGESSGLLSLALRAVTDHAEAHDETSDGEAPMVGLEAGEEEEHTVTIFRAGETSTVTLR